MCTGKVTSAYGSWKGTYVQPTRFIWLRLIDTDVQFVATRIPGTVADLNEAMFHDGCIQFSAR